MYRGTIESQLASFEQKGKEVFGVLLAKCEVSKDGLKNYFAEESLIERR